MARAMHHTGEDPTATSRLRLTTAGATPVLALEGEFDLHAVPDIDRFLRRRLGPLYYRRHLVIDLGGTTFVDSSFIGFLVRLIKDLRAARRELVLAAPMGQVRRTLGLVGLPNLVPVFESVDEALRALAGATLPLIPPRFTATRV